MTNLTSTYIYIYIYSKLYFFRTIGEKSHRQQIKDTRNVEDYIRNDGSIHSSTISSSSSSSSSSFEQVMPDVKIVTCDLTRSLGLSILCL